MMKRASEVASFRPVAILLAAMLVAPSMRWCEYAWAQVTPECLVSSVVGPSSGTCPAESGSMECGMGACASESCDPSARCAEALDRLSAPTAGSFGADPCGGPMRSPTGAFPEGPCRAWCPGEHPSARPEAPVTLNRAPEQALLAGSAVPDQPGMASFRPVAQVGLSPPGTEPCARPPVRGPPSS